MSGKKRDRSTYPRGTVLLTGLEAVVLVESVLSKVTIEEVAEALDVSTRTVATYHGRGLPFIRDGRRRPVYSWPDVFAWSLALSIKTDRASGKGPRHISREEAVEIALQSERRDMEPAGVHEYVTVPLDWDHPRRRDRLLRALAGVDPRVREGYGQGEE